jgi:hypothetical protein
MLPIAAAIIVDDMRERAGSALPNAPVVPDPEPRDLRTRVLLAAFLRASGRRRLRLADRLDRLDRLDRRPGHAAPVAG